MKTIGVGHRHGPRLGGGLFPANVEFLNCGVKGFLIQGSDRAKPVD